MCSRVSRKYLAILSTVLFCVSAMPARAATITVTNPNDNGPGSLRQALADANDGDLINFAVAGNIVLNSGGLAINKNITISDLTISQLIAINLSLFFGFFLANPRRSLA
jgi:hypothetical protein